MRKHGTGKTSLALPSALPLKLGQVAIHKGLYTGSSGLLYRFAVIVITAINENGVVQKNATKKGNREGTPGTGKRKKGTQQKRLMRLPIRIEFNLGFVTSFYFPFPELASHISNGHETGKYHNVRITQEMLLGSSSRLLRCLTTDFITCCTRV